MIETIIAIVFGLGGFAWGYRRGHYAGVSYGLHQYQVELKRVKDEHIGRTIRKHGWEQAKLRLRPDES